jgi:hypothetical protein
MRRLAAVGAVLGLLAAACGGGSASAGALIRHTPDKTAQARTSRLDMVIDRPQGQATPAGVSLRMAGEVDYEARRGRLSFDLSSLGLPGGGVVEAVFDGTTVYEKLPAALSGALPGPAATKPWLKIDAEAAGKSIGVGGLGGAQSGDPSRTLDYLRGASDTVTKVGADTVRGTPTTHYKAVLDLQKAASASPSGRQAIQSLVKLLGFSKLPADIWVDAQGRLRKLHYTTDLSKSRVASSTPGVAGTLGFTLELYDFGVPVQVAIPPPDQIADLGAAAGAGTPGA